jgi:hypothetical protein
MKHFLSRGALAFVLFTTFAFPLSSHAALTESQIQSILGLLSSFGAEQSVITNVNASLRGQATSGSSSSSSCLALNNNLYLDTTDVSTDGEISRLQAFLGGRVTGYFGPATLQLVQNWQASHGVVSSGSPDTSGYGYVGPKTRSAMSCKNSTPTNTQPTQPTTPTIPNSGTQNTAPTQSASIDQSSLTTSSSNPVITGSASGVSGVSFLLTTSTHKIYDISYSNIPVTNGRWLFYLSGSPLPVGTYYITISAPNGEILNYGTLTITGSNPSPSPSVETPQVSVTDVASWYVKAVYGNIPNTPNTYAFVFMPQNGTSTWYHAQTTASGALAGTVTGNGEVSLSVPGDMPAGVYRLRIFNQLTGGVTGGTIAESASFTVPASQTTSSASATINQDTLNPSSGTSFIISGTANGTTQLYIYVVPSSYAGSTNFQSVTTLNGTTGVLSNSTYLSGGVWYMQFGGLAAGTYKVLVYDYSSTAIPLLVSGTLTVPATQSQSPGTTNAFDASSLTSSTGAPTVTGSALVAPVSIVIYTPQGAYTSGAVYTSNNRWTYHFAPPTPIANGQYEIKLYNYSTGATLATGTIIISQ